MTDPVAHMSVETPILTTKNYILYHVNNYNYVAYSVIEKSTGDEMIYGTLQECFDYMVKGYEL